VRYLPGEGAFFRAVFAKEPELLEEKKPPKKRRAATADEIARMFGMTKG
jgi:hypothetical protein